MNSTDATTYPAPLGMPGLIGASPVTVGVAGAPFAGTGLPIGGGLPLIAAERRRTVAVQAPIGGTAATWGQTPPTGGSTVQHERTTPGDLPPRDPLSQ